MSVVAVAIAVAVHFHCKHDNWKTVLPFDLKLTELMNINKMQVKFENQHDQAIFSKLCCFLSFHCKHDNWKTVLPFDFKLTELININKTNAG